MWQSVKIFERFQYFNFETDFLGNESLFRKTGVLVSKYFNFLKILFQLKNLL